MATLIKKRSQRYRFSWPWQSNQPSNLDQTIEDLYHQTSDIIDVVNTLVAEGSSSIIISPSQNLIGEGLSGFDVIEGEIGPPGVAGQQGLQGITGSIGPSGNPLMPEDGNDGNDGMLQVIQPINLSGIIQTVQVTSTSNVTGDSSNHGTYIDATGLNLTITPVSSANRIRLQLLLNVGLLFSGSGNAPQLGVRFVNVTSGNTVIATFGNVIVYNGSSAIFLTLPIEFIDSPISTNPINYKVQVSLVTNPSGGSGISVNASNDSIVGISTFTAQEILPVGINLVGANGATGPQGPLGLPGFDGADGIDSFIPGPQGPAGGGAPLNSPAFTGTPTAPTPSANDNSTKLATTAYVDTLVTAKTIAKAHNSAVQSIPNGVQTPLTFDTNDIAVGDAMHSTTVNNSRFTALTAGVYLLNGSVLINALVNGLAIIQVRKNGTTILASVTGTLNTSSSVLCPIFIFDIAATNDYYEFLAFQNTGGAQNTDNTASSTFGAAIRISN